MKNQQGVSQIQKAVEIATELDKKKQHIKSFAIFAVICALAAINCGLKQYNSEYDFIFNVLSSKNFETNKYIHYAIALAGVGFFYCAYQLYPLLKMM